MKYSHKDLVEIGYKWLLSRCGFAFKELNAFTTHGEIPDVIGFRHDCSILLEAKTSRADFHADKKKLFRNYPEWGMGGHRFYICETDLIKPDDLPEGWGLIYVNDKGRVRVKIKQYKGNNYYQNQFAEYNKEDEKALMYSALRRLHIRGRLPEIYMGIPKE